MYYICLLLNSLNFFYVNGLGPVTSCELMHINMHMVPKRVNLQIINNSVERMSAYISLFACLLIHRLPQSYKVSQSVPIHYRSVICDGTETTFANCQFSTNTSGCTHDYDAAVVCRQDG